MMHFLFIFFSLLLASPSWAAMGIVGNLGSITSSADNATSAVITTSATLEAGNVVLVFIAVDNTGTTDADFSEVSGIVDSASNNYSKLCEYTNGQTGAGLGATVSLWYSRASSQLTSGGTITVSFANEVDAFSLRAFEFTAGAALELVGTCQQAAADAIDPPSQAISGLSSTETLFVRAIAEESGAAETDLTATASYTSIVTLIDARGGTGSGGMTLHGEYRIVTATGDTSDPSHGTDADNANVYIALRESSGTIRKIPSSLY